MAITQNTYTGDGSTTAFSFTFPYLETTDIKVSLDAVDTTAYSLSNATTVSFTTAPASGVAIRIYRNTSSDNLQATFHPGSAIRSSDLNNNFTQNLYVTQESEFDVDTATATANTAKTTADTATATANSATATANAASATAASAASDATSAVSTANTASTNATTAVTTANNAVATANAASAAVSAAAFYTPIAALANLPSSPSNNDRVEVIDSTGVQSSSAVSGVPTGFVGSTNLTVRLQYNSSTSKWAWQQYFAADPENRYAANYLAVIKGDGTSSGQVGKITLNCSNNSHGVSIQSPAHSAGATYTLTLPVNTGSANQALTTDGAGVLSWATTDISGKADIASPTFTGTPAAPTAAVSTNTTQLATTAFVVAEIADEIGTTVQAFDADTAKTDVAQTYTAAQRGTITTLTSGSTVTP
ncbi:MAG: phage tail fiber protein, partial [Pseudomonadota bacterium]|nr:phage tail fiber protein [Pseudomonadota bacterium]